MKVNEASLEHYGFNRSYSTSKDDLLNDFYIPALENSLKYDRAAGFFSSGLVALAPLAFSRFIQGGGRIRLICSPNFSATDIAAIKIKENAVTHIGDQIFLAARADIARTGAGTGAAAA
jgi:hypothetical protein